MTDEEKPTLEEDLEYFVDIHLPRKRATMLALLGELIKDERLANKGLNYCTVEETKNKENIVLTLYVSYGLCSEESYQPFVDLLAELMNDTEIEERDVPPKAKEAAIAELIGDGTLAKLLAHKRGSVPPEEEL